MMKVSLVFIMGLAISLSSLWFAEHGFAPVYAFSVMGIGFFIMVSALFLIVGDIW